MPTRVACPGCQAPLAFSEVYVGKEVQCGRCKLVFVATAPPPTPPVEELLEAEIVDAPAAPAQQTPAPQQPSRRAANRRDEVEEDEDDEFARDEENAINQRTAEAASRRLRTQRYLQERRLRGIIGLVMLVLALCLIFGFFAIAFMNKFGNRLQFKRGGREAIIGANAMGSNREFPVGRSVREESLQFGFANRCEADSLVKIDGPIHHDHYPVSALPGVQDDR